MSGTLRGFFAQVLVREVKPAPPNLHITNVLSSGCAVPQKNYACTVLHCSKFSTRPQIRSYYAVSITTRGRASHSSQNMKYAHSPVLQISRRGVVDMNLTPLVKPTRSHFSSNFQTDRSSHPKAISQSSPMVKLYTTHPSLSGKSNGTYARTTEALLNQGKVVREGKQNSYKG
jgi:hypothetical protein